MTTTWNACTLRARRVRSRFRYSMNSLSKSDGGQYRCKATNVAGSAELIATLQVQKPPELTLEPGGSIVVSEGSRLRLSCSVTGDPLPNVQWRKMGAGEAGSTL